MLHPNTELRLVSPQIGCGVFATTLLPMGTITWVQDPLDQVLSSRRFGRLASVLKPSVDKYSFVNRDGDRILCWDMAKFMNHSCEANVLSPGLEFEMAIRDIQAGEQITGDYGSYNLDASFECGCGEPSCRKLVAASDFEAMASLWDERLRRALPRIASVPQPLWSGVTSKQILEAALSNPRVLPSILEHRWRGLNQASAAKNGKGGPKPNGRRSQSQST